MRNLLFLVDFVMKWCYFMVVRDEGGVYINIVVNIYLRIFYK